VAPTRKTLSDPDGSQKDVTNGIRIHRLKNGFGTKKLPTAELEFKDARAHRVKPKGRGVATIALLLNITRTHNFVIALSCLRRCIDIANNFAKVRRTIDQPLLAFQMHPRPLSQLEVKHRGLLYLAFFITSLLSFSDIGLRARCRIIFP
jgi:alkylation response protein AidB-like acyl-CoA dehydrogenase